MNTVAAISGWPTRDSALLIAEARPALRTGTEPMSAVVSGATSIEMPMPKMIVAGNGSVSTSNGGTRLAAFEISAGQACDVGGTRTHHQRPAGMTSRPATR